MTNIDTIERVLAEYPKDHRFGAIDPVVHPSGLGGAEHWRIEAPVGTLCLRRWSENLPGINRLQYIQAVLWYAVCEGFELVPLPCETTKHRGFVSCEHSLWELMPWMPGVRDKPEFGSKTTPLGDRKDKRNETEKIDEAKIRLPQARGASRAPGDPEATRLDALHSHEALRENGDFPEESPDADSREHEKTASEFFERKMRVPRIVAALKTLARFHVVTATFPLPNEPLGHSEIVKRYLKEWKDWVGGEISLLLSCIREREKNAKSPLETNLIRQSHALIDHFLAMGVNGMMMFARGTKIPVPIQPCIGNASRRHLLFEHEKVSGMIDFKELGADTVARDIASLLGSMAGNDPQLWSYGLKAYRSIRNLREGEIYLTTVIDFAEMILSGLRRLDQVFLKQYPFREEQLRNIFEQIHRQVTRLDDYRFGRNLFVA